MSPKEALLALVQGGVGLEWAKNRTGWSSDSIEPVCEWTHIECDPVDEKVTSIILNDADLYATIPTDLFQLKSLVEINFENNELRGTIPRGIFNSLPELSSLNLNSNNLDGEIPLIRRKLTNLVYLSMNKNRLYGTIQSDIGIMASPGIIEHLDLSHNSLTGTIPDSVTGFKNMNYLDLSFNRLDGSIPKTIGEMKNMKGLFINRNNLIGTIPPSLTRTDLKLIQLFLENNSLSGTIPAGLSDLTMLVDLFIDENKFTGTVPVDLCHEDLNADFFRGEFNLPGRDGCTSVSCPVNTVSREGVFPCTDCGERGFNPYLGLGGGRCFQMNEKRILDILYDKTDGLNWKGGDGWRMDEVAVCAYEGVSCSISGHVHSIKLPNMKLSGPIPVELGFLRNLNTLDLSDNKLTGYLPSDLRFAPLEHLDVGGNKLKGFVPPMLCLTGDINGNGNDGIFDCSHIACPAGTYNPENGHIVDENNIISGEKVTGSKCVPCESNQHMIGQKECADSTTKASFHSFDFFSQDKVGLFGLMIGLFSMVSLLVIKLSRMKKATSTPENGRSPKQHTMNDLFSFYEQYDKSHTRNVGNQKLNENQSLVEMETYPTRGGERKKRGGGKIKSMQGRVGRTIGRAASFRNVFTSPTDEQVKKAITSPDEDIWDAQRVSENELWLDVPKII